MKKIEAIIRKTKFEEVKEALLSSDIDWFDLSIMMCMVSARVVRKGSTVVCNIQRM